MSPRARRYTRLNAAALVVYLVILPVELAAVRVTRTEVYGIDKAVVAAALAPHAARNEYPERLTLNTRKDREHDVNVTYTLNPDLQDTLTGLYERYRPDYAAFVALDPTSGKVLAIASYVKDERDDIGNLALRASYPAASVFKIVTAAAAIDQGMVEPNTVVPYNGKSSSLYKRQVLQHKDNRWTRRPTLRKAFAKSVNTVFARLGVFRLGAQRLNDYAQRFGFNTVADSDLDFELGSSDIDQDTWSIAETASGYTLATTLSPVHGAMIASAAINGGRMPEPYVVRTATDDYGMILYAPNPTLRPPSVSPEAAVKLRTLMVETVRSGSARSAFSRFFVGDRRGIEVGGKTGSLTGLEPKGRNDWFVGYAARGDKKLAYASLAINKERWTVKSAYVARKVIEAYFTREQQVRAEVVQRNDRG